MSQRNCGVTMQNKLTDKEVSICLAIAKGLDNSQMLAIEFNNSKKTIDCHLASIRYKLDCNNMLALYKKIINIFYQVDLVELTKEN